MKKRHRPSIDEIITEAFELKDISKLEELKMWFVETVAWHEQTIRKISESLAMMLKRETIPEKLSFGVSSSLDREINRALKAKDQQRLQEIIGLRESTINWHKQTIVKIEEYLQILLEPTTLAPISEEKRQEETIPA